MFFLGEEAERRDLLWLDPLLDLARRSFFLGLGLAGLRDRDTGLLIGLALTLGLLDERLYYS